MTSTWKVVVVVVVLLVVVGGGQDMRVKVDPPWQ